MPTTKKPGAKPDHAVQFGAEVDLEFVRQMRMVDGSFVDLPDGEALPDGAEEVFDIVIATETPCSTPMGLVILSLEDGAVDMSMARRGLSFLLEHGGRDAPFRVDPDMHVGVVENVRVETARGKRELRGAVRFGPSARAQLTREEFKQKVRPFISAGWLIAPGQRAQLVRAGGDGKPDTYLVKRWIVCEASSVSVPADANSRVGFSAATLGGDGDEPGEEPKEQEVTQMKRVMGEGGTVIEVADDDPRPAVQIEQRNAGGGGGGADDQRIAARNKEIGEIVNVCLLNGVQSRASEFISAGLTLEQVKGRILDIRSADPTWQGQPAAERLVPLSKKDAERYSTLRALRCGLALRGESGYKAEGLEYEVHQEILKNAQGKSIQTRGGIFIPMRVHDAVEDNKPLRDRLGSADYERQTRAVSMGPGIAGGGAEIVASAMGDLIDLLRNRTMCTALGARVLPGLVGSISWPRVTNDPTVRWMGTNPASGAADSGVGYGFVTSSPKTMIGTIPFPRQLVNLTNIDVEADLKTRLAIGHGLALDAGGLTGAGNANEPLGLLNNPDIQTLSMGNTVPTYKLLRQAIGMALKKNVAGDLISYLTTPEMAAVLSATLKASNVPGFIWEGRVEDGTIGGYRSACTNQMPITGSDHAMLAGAFEYMVFALWGALELIVDPISLATSGQIRITSFQQGDVVCQRPEGFVSHTGARLA